MKKFVHKFANVHPPDSGNCLFNVPGGLCGQNFGSSIVGNTLLRAHSGRLFMARVTLDAVFWWWIIAHSGDVRIDESLLIRGKNKFYPKLCFVFIFVQKLGQCGFFECLKVVQCPRDGGLGLESVHLCLGLQPGKSILLLIWIPQPVSGAQTRLQVPVSGIPAGYHLDFCQWLSGGWLTRCVIPKSPFDKIKCLPLWFAWRVWTFSWTLFGPDAEVPWREISASMGTSPALVLRTSSQGHRSPQQNGVFLCRRPLCPLWGHTGCKHVLYRLPR